MVEYTIIRDTREKDGKGWNFTAHPVIDKKLDTGDYSLLTYENIFTIERKATVSEVAKNIQEKRFIRELERMDNMKHAYVILEFTLEDLLTPQRFVKVNPHFLLKTIVEYTLQYPQIQIIFAGNRGKDIASSIFKRIVEKDVKQSHRR